jgi:hypothetical protein
MGLGAISEVEVCACKFIHEGMDDRALPVGMCGGYEEEDIASVYLGEGHMNRPPYDSRLIRLQGVGPVKVENRIAGGP